MRKIISMTIANALLVSGGLAALAYLVLFAAGWKGWKGWKGWMVMVAGSAAEFVWLYDDFRQA